MRTLRFALPALVALTLVSCSGDDTFHPSLNVIGGRILFQVDETYAPGLVPAAGRPAALGPPVLHLAMETMLTYGNREHVIHFEWSIEGNRVRVTPLGVYGPDVIGEPGPAHGEIVLALNPGDYVLEFAIGDLVDAWDLAVTDDRAVVSGDPGIFTTPRFTLYWRVRPRTFAYACVAEAARDGYCDEAPLRWLGELGLVEFDYPAEGRNYWTANGTDTSASLLPRWFAYEDETDFGRAAAVLDVVVDHHPGITTPGCLSIVSWRGQAVAAPRRTWPF